MGIGYKYNQGCGCGSKKTASECCQRYVQPAPAPCCESHNTVIQPSICFRPTADVVAVEGGFYITFENDCSQQIPLNIREVFFYHASAGLLRITGKKNGSYFVELADAAKAGAVIAKGDCVMTAIIPDSMNPVNSSRCLLGQFVAPALDATQTIYLENGSSIPLGSTLTFVYNGEVGSYQVTAFISASGTTYAYQVQNVGNGHTPGTIIDAGPEGSCNIPVELITEFDFCSLAETNVADSIVSCVNGTPRSLVPTGENDTIVGKSDGSWGLARVNNLDCCVVIDGCLKFTGQTCPGNSDSVVLRDINIECFQEAINEALDQEQVLAMNINGFKVIVTAFNPTTFIATFEVAEDTNLTTPLTFDAGTQICLGDCCASCLIGPGSTEVKDPLVGITSPLQSVNGNIDVPAGVSYWLLGLNNVVPQTIQLQQLTAPYFAAPGPNGPILPKFSDSLVFRQKICNNSKKGCYQFMMMQLNYLLAFDPMPANMIVDWELAHYAAASDTLDNGLPNPYRNIGTQQKVSDRLVGPSLQDPVLLNTSFGLGNPGDNKVFPFSSGDFRDLFTLIKCDCALSVIWLFVRIDSPGAQLLNFLLRIRRHMQFFDDRRVAMPLNQPQTNGWA